MEKMNGVFISRNQLLHFICKKRSQKCKLNTEQGYRASNQLQKKIQKNSSTLFRQTFHSLKLLVTSITPLKPALLLAETQNKLKPLVTQRGKKLTHQN